MSPLVVEDYPGVSGLLVGVARDGDVQAIARHAACIGRLRVEVADGYAFHAHSLRREQGGAEHLAVQVARRVGGQGGSAVLADPRRRGAHFVQVQRVQVRALSLLDLSLQSQKFSEERIGQDAAGLAHAPNLPAQPERFQRVSAIVPYSGSVLPYLGATA